MIKDGHIPTMSLAEYKHLQTDAGRIRFLAEHAGLTPKRVAHIEKFEQNWPPVVEDEHIHHIAQVSGEEEVTIRLVHAGVLAYHTRISELLGEEVQRMEREEDPL